VCKAHRLVYHSTVGLRVIKEKTSVAPPAAAEVEGVMRMSTYDGTSFVDEKVVPVGKVDERLPVKGNSNSHGERPVHLNITMIKWIRNSRLSLKNSLSLSRKRPF